MSVRADFIVYDSSGHAQTIIEVKAKRKTTDDWAAQLRRNLLAHGFSIATKYFMVITLDRIYLWKSNDGKIDSTFRPLAAVKADTIWRNYSHKGELSGPFVDGRTFELIVHNWLRDVCNQKDSSPVESLPHEMLEAIQGARIVAESQS